MSKAVLISIQPKWCGKIANEEKEVEVRKNRPKLEPPFTCYIYCTLPPKSELFTHGCIREYANELIRLQNGEVVYGYGMQLCCDPEVRPYSRDNFLCKKVIGEFICDRIDKFQVFENGNVQNWNCAGLEKSCLSYDELAEYVGRNRVGYSWHISGFRLYDTPKELNEFGLRRPPQAWCYIETEVLGCPANQALQNVERIRDNEKNQSICGQ